MRRMLCLALAVPLLCACESPRPVPPPVTPSHEPLVDDALRPTALVEEAPPRSAAVAPASGERRAETLELHVSGMTCPIKCTREVREMLQPVPGVMNVVIDYDRQMAIVTVRTGTDPSAVVGAVTDPYSATRL